MIIIILCQIDGMAEANPLGKEFLRGQPQLLIEIILQRFGVFSRTVPVLLHEFDLHVFLKEIPGPAGLDELCDRHRVTGFESNRVSPPVVKDIMRHVVAAHERNGKVCIRLYKAFLLIVGEGFDGGISKNI